MDVPFKKLTYKQQKFVIRYITNGENAAEAYTYAYDAGGMNSDSIRVEASKLLKNPNIALWISYYRENVQEYLDREINYSANDAFLEFEELQKKCMSFSTTYSVALKAIENKCKLKNHYSDKIEISTPAVQMGSVEVEGEKLVLKIGEAPKNDN